MHEHLNTPCLPPNPSTLPFYSKPYRRQGNRPIATLCELPCQGRANQEGTPVNARFPRDISSRFGLRLRELRRARDMTQLRMSLDFGIDRSFISDLERGRKSISLVSLEVIALGLELSLSDLLRDL
jgi:hypothetical protein